ncbi:MAG: cation transporter [Actinomycetota bacterium]
MTTPVVLSVPEMSCDHCVAAITGAVRPVAGVESVAVDLDAKTVAIIGGERSAIVAAIDDAGYDVV